MSDFSTMDRHTKEDHSSNVNLLCRICLKRAKTVHEARRPSKSHLCIDYKFSIYSVYGIDIEKDEAGKHSSQMCKKCKRKMEVRFSRNYIQKESEKIEVLKNEQFWITFKDTDKCTLCEYVKDLPKQSRAEAAKKKKRSTVRTTQHTCTDELQETVSNVKFSRFMFVIRCTSNIHSFSCEFVHPYIN